MNLKQSLKQAINQNWQSVNETQYAIIDKDNTVLIAFQGSMDWKDWLLNFYCLPYKDMEKPFYVHAGFLKQYKNVRDIVLEAVKGKKKVELRGHSLGGALCLLAHEDIRFHDPDIQIETITFGAPRVIPAKTNWEIFLERVYWAKNGNIVNIINGNDIVPKLPFWFYRNLRLNHVDEKQKWWKWSIKDHLPANYLKTLEKENI